MSQLFHQLRSFFFDHPLPRNSHTTSESDLNAQKNKIFKLCGLYCLVAIFFLTVFGINSILEDKLSYGLILLSFALATALGYLGIWLTGTYYLVTHLVVILMATLCLFLFYSGGVANTGPLWYFIFPSLALFLQGMRLGLISVVALVIFTVLFVIIGLFDLSRYSLVFLERMGAIYFCLTAVSYLFAHSRNVAESALEKSLKRMEVTSNTDKLTGLINRRRMEELLEGEIFRCQRYQTPFTLVMVDIDYFKRINDTLGHHYGDYVLETLSRIFIKSLRQIDIPCRWGGEEFLILLPNTIREPALLVTERVRKILSDYPFSLQGKEQKVTASFGVCEYQKHLSMEELIQQIDKNLYQAKNSGRNCVVG